MDSPAAEAREGVEGGIGKMVPAASASRIAERTVTHAS